MDNFRRGAFAQVIHIRLISQTKRGDLPSLESAECALNNFNDKMWLRIIDLARVIDEGCQFGSGFYKEPRIHANAMTTDSGARVENVNTRVAICQADGFPDVHSKFFSKTREFVCNGDIYIAGGVFH